MPVTVPLAGADPADPNVKVAGVGYRSTVAPYTRLRPVGPAGWREQKIALAAVTSISAIAWAGEGPKGHSHDEAFSAGEPGDPKKPARIVQVTMGEMDQKMMFMPMKIDVKKGEQINFVLRNNGELDHEFLLATTAENLKHAEAMKKNPDMEHDDPNVKRLRPKST